jgi:predicted nucleic acid-binding protein
VYLLDTNVISELRKPRPHGGVVAWLKPIGDDDLHLSAVTLGELQTGVDITREQDSVKAEEIEDWIDQIAGTWNVLPLDGRTLRTWAKLIHRRSDDQMVDGLIAATAIVHHLQVVTRNVRDFTPFGVQTLNPFDGREQPEKDQPE